MVEDWGRTLALVVPQTHFDGTERPYTGAELRPHWIYETFGIQGDAAVAFIGPAEVKIQSMVDMADRRDGLFIAADLMLHFLVESFDPSLDRAVLLQKLLVLLAVEELTQTVGNRLTRKGDDIFLGGGKLTVSIATVSTVSCLIHLGINVTNEGTPVKTGALCDCGLETQPFAEKVLRQFAMEMASMAKATTKVRGVR